MRGPLVPSHFTGRGQQGPDGQCRARQVVGLGSHGDGLLHGFSEVSPGLGEDVFSRSSHPSVLFAHFPFFPKTTRWETTHCSSC